MHFSIANSFPDLNLIVIPRWLDVTAAFHSRIDIHAISDLGLELIDHSTLRVSRPIMLRMNLKTEVIFRSIGGTQAFLVLSQTVQGSLLDWFNCSIDMCEGVVYLIRSGKYGFWQVCSYGCYGNAASDNGLRKVIGSYSYEKSNIQSASCSPDLTSKKNSGLRRHI